MARVGAGVARLLERAVVTRRFGEPGGRGRHVARNAAPVGGGISIAPLEQVVAFRPLPVVGLVAGRAAARAAAHATTSHAAVGEAGAVQTGRRRDHGAEHAAVAVVVAGEVGTLAAPAP